MILIDALHQLAEHYDVIPEDILFELTEMFDTDEETILALWG
jgi:hypothetical protein